MPSAISGGGSFTASSTDTLTNKSIDANTNTLTNLSVTSVKDGSDSTKVLAFDVSAISTATTRTLTYPNSNTSIPVIGQTLTLSGPTAARTITLPDANFTVARTDAANTFTGVQTMTSPVLTTPSLGVATATSVNGNTITTGTGTLTLSTFTLTVPATGTTALRGVANTFTADQDVTYASAANGRTKVGTLNSTASGSGQVWADNSSGEETLIETFGSAASSTIAGVNKAHLGRLLFSGVTNGLISTDNAAPIVFAVNSTETMRLPAAGGITFPATNTAGGTTGAQTINKTSGTVNFAATATSLTVTNSLVTTSSIVFAVVRTNDSTATIKNVVPGTGSFTITITAAATAETSVGFYVIN